MVSSRNGRGVYRGINYSYSVFADGHRFRAEAWINFTEPSQDVFLDQIKDFETAEISEVAIINEIERRIDKHLL